MKFPRIVKFSKHKPTRWYFNAEYENGDFPKRVPKKHCSDIKYLDKYDWFGADETLSGLRCQKSKTRKKLKKTRNESNEGTSKMSEKKLRN